eukprot:scaffold49542_cov20-Tisochrysis_lutea.AAC.4
MVSSKSCCLHGAAAGGGDEQAAHDRAHVIISQHTCHCSHMCIILPQTCCAVQKLLSLGGVELLLEVVMNMQPVAERPSHDLIVSALQALQLVALSPFARKAVAGQEGSCVCFEWLIARQGVG